MVVVLLDCDLRIVVCDEDPACCKSESNRVRIDVDDDAEGIVDDPSVDAAYIG